ncbi:hypothetical protein BC833DRAFT_573857 [Globomyces pollinis-pini]|nr:hypothetical protein BC833DRAFT_573857 [Globomyces pollinis-pini]
MDKLLPKDIELIGCLGDSLFTGLGVTAFPSKWKNKIYQWLFKYNKLIPWILSGEHRQNTCILGGGKGVISVGRLLKRYNPALQGLNTRKTRMFSRGSDYNFATTGAKSQNLRMQTIRMVRRFKRDRTTHSVKILFLWIGVNDAFSKSHKSLEKTFVGDIVTALALIKTHLPNTFVCILPLPNLGQVLKDVGSEKRTKIISKIKLINQLLWDVTNDWDFNGDYYFRVTFQPIPFDDLDNPEFLNMYPLISTLDDQHPSFIAQQLFAKCIWNNLFLKPEHKVTSIQQVIDSAWYEPTEDDYCQ